MEKAPLLLNAPAIADACPLCLYSIDSHSTYRRPYLDGRGTRKLGAQEEEEVGFGEHMALSLAHEYANIQIYGEVK